MVTYEPADKLIPGGTYRIIIDGSTAIPAFANQNAGIWFTKVNSFSTPGGRSDADYTSYNATGYNTYDLIGYGTCVDPETWDQVQRFGLFTTFYEPWTSYGFQLDKGLTFEVDIVLGRIINVSASELDFIKQFFYSPIEKQLKPYLKGLADTIRSVTPISKTETYHLHIPAGMLTTATSGMGYAGISFSSISNIVTDIIPESTDAYDIHLGECYMPSTGVYSQAGISTGTGLVYDLVDSPYDFDADVVVSNMSTGMPGTLFDTVDNMKILFTELSSPISPQDFGLHINSLKVEGTKTITSAGYTDVSKYEQVYLVTSNPNIRTTRSYTQYGTVVTPSSSVQYINLPQGFNTAKSIRVEAASGGTGIPPDYAANNGTYYNATITINNTSSYTAYYMTSSQTAWNTINPGASATVTAYRYFIWIKTTGSNNDIRAYKDTTQLDYVMDTSGNTIMRMFASCINGNIINKITISNCSCLRGDTLVTMADKSYKRLDEIEVGDMILAYDWSTMKLGAHEVLKTNKYDTTNFVEESTLYTFDDGTELEVMNHHKFYNVEHKCFMNMSEWQIGEHTLKEDGTHPALVSIQDLHERKQHYTLSILGGVNYFANGLISGDSIAPKDIDLTIDYE